jgi:hypothetical protein
MYSDLPKELCYYNTTLVNQGDVLICELKYGSKKFYSQITSSNLKSNYFNLIRLSYFIEAHSKSLSCKDKIWIEPIEMRRNDSDCIVMNILITGDYVCGEKIYFKDNDFSPICYKQNAKVEQKVDQKKLN